jgi:hypothetical protein
MSYHKAKIRTRFSAKRGETMNLSKRNIRQPFLFWLIDEFTQGENPTEEEVRPITDREFFLWMGILSVALLCYGVVFHFIA